MNILKSCSTPLNWLLYSLSGLIFAFFIGWLILAKVNFGYAWLHDAMNIQQHAEKYGPQNRYRNGFQYTDKQEHIRLFSAINTAVHHQGSGLKDIKYQHNKGRNLGVLLRHAEVLHLKDVANLLNILKYIALGAAIIWFFYIVLFQQNKAPTPNFKQQSLIMLAVAALCGISILLIGPTTIFYTFHEWIFPENHKWFFYYQESLMTILMKAPDLFGAIALLLSFLSLLIFVSLNLCVYHFINNKKRLPKHGELRQKPAKHK
ncbi:MAG: DUF1461 domain-containing protein [Bermanella sp.]